MGKKAFLPEGLSLHTRPTAGGGGGRAPEVLAVTHAGCRDRVGVESPQARESARFGFKPLGLRPRRGLKPQPPLPSLGRETPGRRQARPRPLPGAFLHRALWVWLRCLCCGLGLGRGEGGLIRVRWRGAGGPCARSPGFCSLRLTSDCGVEVEVAAASFRDSGRPTFPGTSRRGGPGGSPAGHRRRPRLAPPGSRRAPGAAMRLRALTRGPPGGCARRSRARRHRRQVSGLGALRAGDAARGEPGRKVAGRWGAGCSERGRLGRSERSAFRLVRARPVCPHTLVCTLVQVCTCTLVCTCTFARAPVGSYVHECACVLVCACAPLCLHAGADERGTRGLAWGEAAPW